MKNRIKGIIILFFVLILVVCIAIHVYFDWLDFAGKCAYMCGSMDSMAASNYSCYCDYVPVFGNNTWIGVHIER